MLDTHYRRYMKPSRMTADRSSLVAAQLITIARAFDDQTLERQSEALAEAATASADIDEIRRLQREARGGDEDNPFDDVADAAVHQYYDDLTGVTKYAKATNDSRLSRLKGVAERHFTTGVGHITSARYETQLMRMQRLVADLRGPSADLVDQFGWDRKVRAIEAALGPYSEAIAARNRVTGGDARAAQDEMHFALCRLVAYVLWAYAERAEDRDRILAPLDDQQDRIAALMRARRNGRSGPVSEAAVADEADALDGAVEGLSPEEQAQVEAPAGAPGEPAAAPEAVRIEGGLAPAANADAANANAANAEGPAGSAAPAGDRGGEGPVPRP